MDLQITKENYRDLTWDEDIPFDAYNDFYKILDFEERINFLKFLIAYFPNYHKDWIHYFFDIIYKWRAGGNWAAIADFSDFVRENAPSVYQKKFSLFDEEAVMYALFNKDIEKAKVRFAETVRQPEEAIDDSLPAVFHILTIDPLLESFTKEVAATVWKPLEQSDKLLGGAEFNYSSYLYCQYLEEAFAEIQAGQSVDWDEFEKNVVAINFKYVPEFEELPDFFVPPTERFHIDKVFRDEQLNEMAASFFYVAYTELGIPVYWAFRAWFLMRQYLWEDQDASKRKNWFTFTPKMLDRMGGSLYGFLGSNKECQKIVTFVFPYFYDYFLKLNYIDQATYDRLMDYYQFSRRSVLEMTNNHLWKYSSIYSWKKPDFITQENFEKEKKLVLDSINWTKEEATEAVKNYINTLPELSPEAIPPIEKSLFEKLLSPVKESNSIRPQPKKRGTNMTPKKKKRKKR